MASVVSDVFDVFKAKIVASLPTHGQLANPYFPETTSDLALAKAFGLSFAEGLNLLGNEASGNEQRSRNFIVTLTRRKFATKGNTTARETTEKDLMDDWSTLMDAIAQDQHLGRPDLIQRALYVSDDGIEFLRAEQNRNDILLVRTIVSVEYEEIVQLCV